MLTKEEASKLLAEKVKQLEALLKECEDIATEHKLSFDIYPAYGMGGTFYGEPDDWMRSEYDVAEGEGMWYSSSMSC